MATKNAAASACIRELCSLGLTGELLIPALLEALHRVVPSARNLFDWVDRNGRILRYYFEGPIDHQAARRYFDEFHNRREAEAMPKYADVIRGSATIRSAEELNHRHFFDSALYNEIWRPQRLHYRLEAIVRGTDHKAMGSLVLYREHGDRIFGKADEDILLSLVPYIAHGLRHGKERRVDYAQSDRRAVLVSLDELGRIVHMSRNAHKVLLLAHGDISPESAARDPVSERFPSLALLHRQLCRSNEFDVTPCTLTLTNPWGRFEFQAERLDAVAGGSPALIGVTIRHLQACEVGDLKALEALPLSITQKKVCGLVLQGLSQPQIAERLGVSKNTVIDHVRQAYRKLDVHSVAELRAKLADHRQA